MYLRAEEKEVVNSNASTPREVPVEQARRHPVEAACAIGIPREKGISGSPLGFLILGLHSGQFILPKGILVTEYNVLYQELLSWVKPSLLSDTRGRTQAHHFFRICYPSIGLNFLLLDHSVNTCRSRSWVMAEIREFMDFYRSTATISGNNAAASIFRYPFGWEA